MGKKLIIPNADFSANCIEIPVIATIAANATVELAGITYGPYNEDTDVEISSLPSAPGFGGINKPGVKKLYYGVAYSGTAINHSKLSDLVSVYYNKTITVTNLNNIYSECSSLLEADLSKFDISSITGMTNAFYKCRSLKKVTFPQGMNISGVSTGVGTIFSNCSSLRTIIAPSLLSTDKDTEGSDTSKIATAVQYSGSSSVDLVCSDRTIHWNGSSWS